MNNWGTTWESNLVIQEKGKLCEAKWAKTKVQTIEGVSDVDMSVLSKDFEKQVSVKASHSPAFRYFKQGNQWWVIGQTGCLAETEKSLSTSRWKQWFQS